MAYPFYQPQAQYQQYFPVSYQQPQMPTQMQNQQQNPVANQNGIIWISGESEAAMYPIAPNNAVALWEKSGKTIYLKSADATGKPNITVYDLVKRETVEPDGEPKRDYATKEDLGNVVGVVKDCSAMLDALKADVESIKGDMYGIAGKKKTAKKAAEVTDDE